MISFFIRASLFMSRFVTRSCLAFSVTFKVLRECLKTISPADFATFFAKER